MANESFQYVADKNEIIISHGHEQGELYSNTLKMWINFEEGTKCEPDEIRYKFQMGIGEGDFAQESDIQGISCSLSEGWTLHSISLRKMNELRQLRKERKVKSLENDRLCFLLINKEENDYIYTFYAPNGWTFEKNPAFEVEFSNVITTAAEGVTRVGCQICYEEKSSSGTYTIRKKKQEEAVRIRDFYPEKGAAFKGEEIRLNWKVENAQTLTLYVDDIPYPQDTARSSYSVSPTKSTRYCLKAVNGEASDQRETLIQILPLYLKKFQLNEDMTEVEWDVPCAESVTINGETVRTANTRSLKDFSCPGKIILTAKGTDTDIESVLYYGTEDERKDIVHFRKTITYYKEGGFQILNVEWKRYQVDMMRNVAKSIRIVYQDRERNELYVIKGKDELEIEGSWEQILTGTDPERVCENILMTMNVSAYKGTGGQDYDITI